MTRRAFAAVVLVSLVLTACSGADDDQTSPTTEPTEQPTTAPTSPTPTGTPAEPTSVPPPDQPEDAPSGNPFESTEVFCEPYTPDGGDLGATDRGVTADEIAVGVMHLDLAIAESFGLSGDVGDQQLMWQVFSDAVNDCGGIHGRALSITFHESDLIDLDDQLRSCIEATEDTENFVLGNTTSLQGATVTCLTDDHETPFFSVGGYPREFYERAEGRLFSTTSSDSRILEGMVLDLHEKGLLTDQRIGVVRPDTPGLFKAVQESLVDLLEELGHDVVSFQTVPCNGTLICLDDISLVVENLRADDVDVVFPTLNLAALPALVSEAETQGLRPRWYNSGFNGQDISLSARQIKGFGGDAAVENYDGTWTYTPGNVGAGRAGEPATEFQDMCNRVYDEATGEGYVREQDGWSSVNTVCSQVRILARGMYDAGPELTRDGAVEAWQNLGRVELPTGKIGTFTPDKTDGPDEMRVVQYMAECGCLEPIDEWRPIPSREP